MVIDTNPYLRVNSLLETVVASTKLSNLITMGPEREQVGEHGLTVRLG